MQSIPLLVIAKCAGAYYVIGLLAHFHTIGMERESVQIIKFIKKYWKYVKNEHVGLAPSAPSKQAGKPASKQASQQASKPAIFVIVILFRGEGGWPNLVIVTSQ